jgi:hypothetical protein
MDGREAAWVRAKYESYLELAVARWGRGNARLDAALARLHAFDSRPLTR